MALVLNTSREVLTLRGGAPLVPWSTATVDTTLRPESEYLAGGLIVVLADTPGPPVAASVVLGSLVWCGPYDATKVYSPGQLITVTGAPYICLQTSYAHAPASSPTYWVALTGSAASLAIGVAVTGATHSALLVADSSGNLASGPATNSVVSASSSGGAPAWAPSTAYGVNVLVTDSGSTYLCKVAHTSGSTFSGEASDWQAIGGSGSTTPVVVEAGNLGATPSQALSATQDTWLVGTLNANCALTLTGLVIGARALLLFTQDGTGGRTLSINGKSVPIPPTPGVSFVVACEYDGTDLYVALVGGGVGGVVPNISAKGQILAADGTPTLQALGVGADGSVLTADAASTEGVKWATPAASGSQPIGTRVQVLPVLDYTAVVGTITTTAGGFGSFYNSAGAQNDAYQFNNIYLEAGTWRLDLSVTPGTNCASPAVAVDGTNEGTVDFYDPSGVSKTVSLTGIVIAAAGLHAVKFTAATKNASSTQYYMNINWLAFRRTA